jgi:dipeptidase D
MLYPCLDNLTPAGFFRWFGEIAAIPHGTGKEQQLTAFLERFAADRNLPCHKDEMGNLLMSVPAHKDYVNQPSILFQAHMDMIWEAAPGVTFDFETQPLDLHVEGDRLLARGTTLGADNAVGMATMLALADDVDLPHPPLQLLFTVQEEGGMVGIRAVDPNTITARRMINMDCGDSHVLCVSSAGKNDLATDREFPLTPAQGTAWQVTLSGGLGGHPGLAANLGRCCCGGALATLLTGLEDLRLCSLTGSSAIMASAAAVIVAGKEAKAVLEERFAALARIYVQTDPGLQLTVTETTADRALTAEDSRSVVRFLSWLPTGQLRCDGTDPRNIVTSGAITALFLTEGHFQLRYRHRSTVADDSRFYVERFQDQAALLGFRLCSVDSYEGWPEQKHSPFRDKFLRCHRRLFDYDLALERCPGGIETGILFQKLPGLDAIGIAPTARGAHTPDEYLSISETADYWQLLLAVLAEKE